MKLFSIMSNWLDGLRLQLQALIGFGAAGRLASDFKIINRYAELALPIVQWIGSEVVPQLLANKSVLAQVLAKELQKFCPELPDAESQAIQLANQSWGVMLRDLAKLVVAVKFGPVPSYLLNTAIEVAHVLYQAKDPTNAK